MSPPPIRFDTEELLAQLGWVRALAQRVASDAHGAEDLTQDTMLVALRGGSASAIALEAAPMSSGSSGSSGVDSGRTASLRRWLAAVVRNLGRTTRRSGRRRTEREATAADRALPPSTLELVERASTHRELVGALLELDEPYRSTLLMRFFEECSQREIADRMGVPISTVSTRIAEGLQRLRRRFTGRETWLSSLLPLFRWPREVALPALTSGAVFVSLQLKLILGAAVLVGGLIAIDSMSAGAPVALGAAPEQEQAQLEPQLAEIPRDLEREVVELELPAPPVAPSFEEIPEHAALVASTASVHGQVIELDGTPVGGVEVCKTRPSGHIDGSGEQVPAQARGCVTSDDTGHFETEGNLPLMLSVQDKRYTTLFEGVVKAGPNDDPAREAQVIVAPRMPLAGVVIDEQGAPVVGARLTLQASIARQGLDLTSLSLVVPETHTDGLGAFEFEHAAAVDHSMLTIRAPGFANQLLPVPPGGDAALVIVLLREGASPYTISGRVVFEDGRPAAEAQVSTGNMAVTTDEQGLFAIDLEMWLDCCVNEQAPTLITAVLPGLLPASRTLPSVNEARESGWPTDLVLELAGQPLTLRGIVVDEHGNPVPGVQVEPADPTPFGTVSRPGMPAYAGIPRTQEELAGSGAATTDSDGRFELTGLLDRDYTLSALSRPSLLHTVTEPIPAHSQNARIVLDHRALGTIEGRILDRHGNGIEGVRVAVSRHRTAELVIGAHATTDEAGAFQINDATLEPEFLRIESPAIVPELFRQLAPNADPTDLQLTVGRRCRLQFDWSSWPNSGDELIVIDEHGTRLTMMRLQGNSIGEAPSLHIAGAVSDVLLVSDAAAHAVVYRKGEEVMRVRLSLGIEELNEVQL